MTDESATQSVQGSKPTATLRAWHLLVLGTLVSAFGFPLILLLLLPLAVSTTALEPPK